MCPISLVYVIQNACYNANLGVNRVVVNRKGIFTRERQPKAAARLLKQRYNTL